MNNDGDFLISISKDGTATHMGRDVQAQETHTGSLIFSSPHLPGCIMVVSPESPHYEALSVMAFMAKMGIPNEQQSDQR